MLKIFWITLIAGFGIFIISYIKLRERIPFYKRDKIEKVFMFLLIILLLVDISLVIFERREISYEINDCIRFYRYFPNFYNDSQFYFINEWCYEYYTEKGIETLRESGRTWQLQQIGGTRGYSKADEISEILKGGLIQVANDTKEN